YPGRAPRGTPRDRAGRDDLPLSDALEAPRADRPEGGRREPLPRERPDRGPRDRRGDRRGALPGAGAARAERARRGSGPREDPRPGAAASAVAAPSVGAQLRQPLLPRGAPPPGDERYVRRHDPRGGPRVSPGRPPRRAARPLDAGGLGAQRGRVSGAQSRREGADGAVRVDRARHQRGDRRLHPNPEAGDVHELPRAQGLRGSARGGGLPGPQVSRRAVRETLVPACQPGHGSRGDSLRAPVTARWAALRRRPRARDHGRLPRRALRRARLRPRRSPAPAPRRVDGEHHLPRDRRLALPPRPDLVEVGGSGAAPPDAPHRSRARPRPTPVARAQPALEDRPPVTLAAASDSGCAGTARARHPPTGHAGGRVRLRLRGHSPRSKTPPPVTRAAASDSGCAGTARARRPPTGHPRRPRPTPVARAQPALEDRPPVTRGGRVRAPVARAQPALEGPPPVT